MLLEQTPQNRLILNIGEAVEMQKQLSRMIGEYIDKPVAEHYHVFPIIKSDGNRRLAASILTVYVE
jgi:hypothetical protein